MADLPKLALSVRQPWAWAIMYAGKDIENRSWQAVNHGLRQRGRIALHASKGLSRLEADEFRNFYVDLEVEHKLKLPRLPLWSDLHRGGIIGSVEVIDVVSESGSPWFFGPRGLVLRDPTPCEFIPAVGALGYFEWKPANASIVPPPARWMLPLPDPVNPKPKDEPTMPLFERH